MVAWDDFASAAPEMAANGRRLIERRGDGEALMASVRGDLPPRIHPINVAIVDGRLLAFLIVGSAKVAELAADADTPSTPIRIRPSRTSSRSAAGRAR